jgi:predicted transcriptional regulator
MTHEMAGIGAHRARIRHCLRATPAGGVLGVEAIADLTHRAAAARRHVLVVVPLPLAPGRRRARGRPPLSPLEIAGNPGARVRDIVAAAGISERTAQGIISALEAAGYITRTCAGRRTIYRVNPDEPFRHRAQDGLRVGPVLAMLTSAAGAGPGPGAAESKRHPG